MAEAPVLAACAPGSLVRGEALTGTASRVRSWLLIEQPGPWGRDALLESRLDPEVAGPLLARCRRAGVRPILIRRSPRAPGSRDNGSVGRRCYLAHSGTRRSWLERLDLDAPGALLDLDLRALAHDEAPGIGAVADPVLLVCTNGRHDRCCSDLGRPLARALVAAEATGPGRRVRDGAVESDVWECSHIGGDRFAANLVCLPEGVYLGRVGVDDGPRVADLCRQRRLSLDHYRGRSSYPPLVQAAELFLRRASGLDGLDDLLPVAVVPRGDDGLAVTYLVQPAVPGPGAGTTTGTGGWRVEVERRRSSAPVVLTCRADHASRPWEYHLVDLVAVPAPEG